MAGAGYRRWIAGEIIRAANVQPYLMDQVVQVFPDVTARASATVSFVSEGMISTLDDNDKSYRYSGTNWVDIQNTPISTVTASATATASNANTLLLVTNAATITIPDVLVIGERIDIERDTSGTVSIVAGTGVSSWAGNGTAGTGVTFLIEKQYGYVSVLKIGANAYRVIGRTTV
jgi:hypothetical protein